MLGTAPLRAESTSSTRALNTLPVVEAPLDCVEGLLDCVEEDDDGEDDDDDDDDDEGEDEDEEDEDEGSEWRPTAFVTLLSLSTVSIAGPRL